MKHLYLHNWTKRNKSEGSTIHSLTLGNSHFYYHFDFSKLRELLILSIILIFVTQNSFSALYYRSKAPTGTSGIWSEGSFWETSATLLGTYSTATTAPSGTNLVTILDGQSITLNGASLAKTLTINSGGTLSTGAYSLTIGNTGTTQGSLTNYGTINVEERGSILVNGSSTLGNLSGGIATVEAGGALTIVSNTILGRNECLLLKSNALYSGTFVYGTFSGSGTIKVARYMSNTNNWHLYSSPIADQSIHEFLKLNLEIPDLYDTSTNVLIGVGMRDYNTATDLWNKYFYYDTTSTTPGSIGSGKGFSVRTYADATGMGTVYSSGTPNSDPDNISLDGNGNRWNCIGNPFTSAIDISAFLIDNQFSIDAGFLAAYIWDSSNLNYIPINLESLTTSVQLGQGFFVKSAGGSQTVVFNKGNIVVADPGLAFKSARPILPSIAIRVETQTLKSSTEIKFVANATIGLDPGHDAGMLKANPDFALYSKLLVDNDLDFTLQCLPDKNYDQYVIPIGIDCKVAGDITFTAETVNLPSGCQALLEDRLTKRFTRLDFKDAKYTAAVSADTKGTGRFYLHTSDVISGNTTIENEPFKIYETGKTVYINGEVSENAKFFVYSANGKLLANFLAESQVQNQFSVSGFPAGVYILTVDDKNQKKSVKFLIEN